MFQFTSSLPQRPPFPIAAFGAATLAVLVAGCGSPQAQVAAPNSDTAPATRIEMVASTDVYGGIVDSVGGDRVHVTSIIHTANQDPHSYEATAQDKLAVSKAQLLVENGGGHDDFLTKLSTQSPATTRELVDVAAMSGMPPAGSPSAAGGEAKPEFNEHFWYNFETMAKLADTIAQELGQADPAGAAKFTANAGNFKSEVGKLRDKLTRRGPGRSPQVAKETTDLISTKAVKFLAYNTQTEGPQTQALKDAAVKAGVPVVDFTETFPEAQSYLQWMGTNVEHVKQALEG